MPSDVLVRTVARTGSTNADLRAALVGTSGALDPASAVSWPHLSALRALEQTAGRGRADHVWRTPSVGALTVSFVLRPLVAAERLAWVPLLGGLAARDAVASVLQEAGASWQARTKWPNDVIAVPAGEQAAGQDAAAGEALPGWGRSRKLVGVLTELVAPAAAPAPEKVPRSRAQAPAVVLGIGVNVAQREGELPVPWASSLALLGAACSPEDLLTRLAQGLASVIEDWEVREGAPDSGDGALGARLRSACDTLGREVRVDTAAGALSGRAVDLAPGLVLQTAGEAGPSRTVVTAGEVTALRRG